MSKVTLKTIRRQSLWEVYDRRCFYCDKILFFGECEIDHIISQDMKRKYNERKRILNYYGLPESFDIDSIENQVPCHSNCNKKKGPKRYSKRAVIFYIEQARSKSQKVKNRESYYKAALKRDYGRGLIKMILERGLLAKRDIISLAEYYDIEQLNLSDETHVITFCLNIEYLFESDSLPEDAPREYPYLCDWLHDNLLEHLASIISTPYYPVEDSRDGETFGVRIVFFRLSRKELDKFSIGWWEICHEGTFTQVYGEPPSKKYFKCAIDYYASSRKTL